MYQMTLISSMGEESEIDFTPGDTLMQTIVNAGIGDLLALCGGVCSCATCHVYLDDALVGQVEPMSDDESDLLEMTEGRQNRSRLSCQIRVTEDFHGKKVTVPEPV